MSVSSTNASRGRFPWQRPLRWLTVLAVVVATGLALTRHGPAGYDEPILRGFRVPGDSAQLAGPVWATAGWRGLSWLGNTTPRLVVTALVIGVLGWRRQWRNVGWFAGLLLSGVALSATLKHWIGRPRPQVVAHLDHVTSASFPSGHTFNSTLFFLAVALLLAPACRGRAARATVWAAAVALPLGIGVARVALGVHYPSDVLASWMLGVAWLGLGWSVTQRFRAPPAAHSNSRSR